MQMRWLSRLRGPARVANTFLSHGSSRRLCSSLSFQTKATTTASSPSSSTSSGARNRASPRLRWIPPVLIFAASAGAAYLYRRQSASSDDDDVINASTFTAFTIVRREQISPTAFIITLRPSAWVDDEEPRSGRVEADDGSAGFLSTRIQEAWRHGLWSVEIKQPQLQIARHYTPLPPLSTPACPSSMQRNSQLQDSSSNEAQEIQSEEIGGDAEDQDWQPDLRILIRRLEGGEMSSYLSRQCVGDTVWLRGPHLGFDIPRRLGDDGGHDLDTGTRGTGRQKGVVFLAGGTGIAPALQIAHKLLEGAGPGNRGERQPYISILWANRWGADALGRDQPLPLQQKSYNWFRFWGRDGSNSGANVQEKQKRRNEELVSSLALQIRDLEQRYPSQFKVSYFVDNEGSFIKTHEIEAALASAASSASPAGTGPSSSSPSVNKSCTWHSAKAIECLPDDNDASRSSSSDPACTCTCISKTGAEQSIMPPGVNLICVSGPDGFIGAYAGAKRWHDGNEMQGTVRGLLGKMRDDKGSKAGEWLVLKL